MGDEFRSDVKKTQMVGENDAMNSPCIPLLEREGVVYPFSC